MRKISDRNNNSHLLSNCLASLWISQQSANFEKDFWRLGTEVICLSRLVPEQSVD
jgi:hypothetical protein